MLRPATAEGGGLAAGYSSAERGRRRPTDGPAGVQTTTEHSSSCQSHHHLSAPLPLTADEYQSEWRAAPAAGRLRRRGLPARRPDAWRGRPGPRPPRRAPGKPVRRVRRSTWDTPAARPSLPLWPGADKSSPLNTDVWPLRSVSRLGRRGSAASVTDRRSPLQRRRSSSKSDI